MQSESFEQYMLSRNLADKTRSHRGYALKRIERAYGVDLDAAFEEDGLVSLMASFGYSASDERDGRPNPSKLDIDPDKLLTHLRWYRSHLVDYVRFLGAEVDAIALDQDGIAASDVQVIEEAVGKTFALERDLQIALRANLDDLESGLNVADSGAERKVESGFIDILARDAQGVLTVIELKADIARPEAIAQILGYMGCLAEETGESVRGILVAADHHPRVKHAVRAVPALMLKRYRYKFDFE
jgi:endonuclease